LKPLSADWQISAGFLAELARPALYASAALASACVLADSRRRFRPRRRHPGGKAGRHDRVVALQSTPGFDVKCFQRRISHVA